MQVFTLFAIILALFAHFAVGQTSSPLDSPINLEFTGSSAQKLGTFLFGMKWKEMLFRKILKDLNIHKEADPYLKIRCISLDRQLAEYKNDAFIAQVRSQFKTIFACKRGYYRLWYWEDSESVLDQLDALSMEMFRRIHAIEIKKEQDRKKDLERDCSVIL